MNFIKGFRFHPTDDEAIQLLRDKQVFDQDLSVKVGDTVVSVITQLKHFCEFDPWELPELSEFETGDKYWYFFSTPNYKYPNSVRKNRITKSGYWNPTGKPRQIVTIYAGERINASKQTLVFYKGRVGNKQKKENKTHWIIHEIELKPPNQRSITLCKLKNNDKKVVTSRDESSHSLYSSQITTNEQDDDEFVNSLLTNDDLPESQENFNGSIHMALNQATTLAMTPQNHVAEDVIPMEHLESNYALQDGLFIDELSPVHEAPKIPDGVDHDAFSINEQDDESWKIFLTLDEVEDYPEIF